MVRKYVNGMSAHGGHTIPQPLLQMVSLDGPGQKQGQRECEPAAADRYKLERQAVRRHRRLRLLTLLRLQNPCKKVRKACRISSGQAEKFHVAYC
jgi:hypothetical protein